MRRFGTIAVCLVSGLVLNTGLCADNGASQKDPYVPIITRNIFGLNPPQASSAPAAPEPPSKITPDGIMTIFGTPQVLFKVEVPPRPPTPATEKSYILSEGQRQDDIEVTHIDQKTGVVTFNNHGVMEEIPLVKAPPITTPTPVVMNPGFAVPAGAPGGLSGSGGGNLARFAGRFGQNNSMGNNGGNSGNNYANASGNNPGGNFGNTGFGNAGGAVSGASGGSAQPQLSPEEQAILIVGQKAQLKQAGDPTWVIYPPTELDEAAGTVNSSQAGGSSSGSSSP